MKETAPAESSWTSAVIDAAYCEAASLVVGPARVLVVLDSTLMTYVVEPSSGMNANSCWTPEVWKKEAVLPCDAGKVAPLYVCDWGWKNETVRYS